MIRSAGIKIRWTRTPRQANACRGLDVARHKIPSVDLPCTAGSYLTAFNGDASILPESNKNYNPNVNL